MYKSSSTSESAKGGGYTKPKPRRSTGATVYNNEDSRFLDERYNANQSESAQGLHKNQMHFLRAAALTAAKSTMAQRHGCVATHGNRIISMGYNYRRSNAPPPPPAKNKTLSSPPSPCFLTIDDDESRATRKCDVHTQACWSLHAEVSAVNSLRKQKQSYLKKCDVYVVRLRPNSVNKKCGLVDNNQHQLHESKPCNACQGVLKRLGIRRVFYSTDFTVVSP